MAEVDVLAQLKDIHLPAEVGWWPLAPGWYVLIAVFFIVLFVMIALLHQRHVHRLPKKNALLLLDSYVAQYQHDHQTQLTCARLSELLKRVALVYYPRREVASMHGQEWIDFLTATSKGIDFESIKTLLLEAPFKQNKSLELTGLIKATQLWIKQRKRPCLN